MTAQKVIEEIRKKEQKEMQDHAHLHQMFRLFQELHDKSTALHALACQATGEESSQINQQLEAESYAIVSSAADAMGHISNKMKNAQEPTKDWA